MWNVTQVSSLQEGCEALLVLIAVKDSTNRDHVAGHNLIPGVLLIILIIPVCGCVSS
jgi:hypothetical protein